MTWPQALIIVPLSVASCVAYRVISDIRRRDRKERAELAKALRSKANQPTTFTLNELDQLRRAADLLDGDRLVRLTDLLDGDR